jgi:hypothetical protein
VISDEDKSLLRRLLEARQAHDEAKLAEASAKTEKDEIELEVFDRFESSGQEGTLKVDLGEPWGVVAFRTRETYYARIIDEDAAIEHFSQRAMLDDVSAPKFSMKKLHDEVREVLESGGTKKMPAGLDYYANRGMTVTRQKS